jgi:hypothetical protein
MAYVTIPQLPLGGALTGLEVFESVQSSVSVKLTATQIKDFVSLAPSFTVSDSATNTVSTAANFRHITNAIPVSGFGVGIDFTSENSTGALVVGNKIQSIEVDPTSTAEFFDLAIRGVVAGTDTEIARFTSGFELGINTTNPSATFHGVAQDLNLSGSAPLLRLEHTTLTGAAGNGIGAAIEFATENNLGGVKMGAAIEGIATNASSGAENFDIAFSVSNAGSAPIEALRIKNTGNLGVGTLTPGTRLEVFLADSNNTAPIAVGRFTHAAGGVSVPGVGIGTGIDFSTETSSNNYSIGGAIYTQSTQFTPNINFDLGFAVMKQGAANVEVIRVSSNEATGTSQTGGRLGVNTTAPVRVMQAVANDAVNSGSTAVARLTHTTTGTPQLNIGTGLEFETSTTSGAKVGAVVESVVSNISTGVENFDLAVRTMTGGATPAEVIRFGNIITPSVQFSQFGAGVAPSATSRIEVGANSLTIAPLRFNPTGATLLTTPVTGAMEYDTDSLYFTPLPNQRGLLSSPMTYVMLNNTKFGPNQQTTGSGVPYVATGQSATFNTSVVNIAVPRAPGNTVGKTGVLVTFTATTLPGGVNAGQVYFVNFVNTTTITISSTPNGPPIQCTTAGSSVVAFFHFVPFGPNNVDSVYLSLSGGVRYGFEFSFAVTHPAVVANFVVLSALNVGGTIGSLSYAVESVGSSTANTPGNLMSTANTSNTVINNFLPAGSNFTVPLQVSGLTGAAANTTNWIRAKGYIDVAADIDYFTFGYGLGNADPTGAVGTFCTVLQGAYIQMWPTTAVGANTQVGNWRIT